MADSTPEPESAEDEAEAERPEDEMKRKFREALDRKRGQLAGAQPDAEREGRRQGAGCARPRAEQALVPAQKRRLSPGPPGRASDGQADQETGGPARPRDRSSRPGEMAQKIRAAAVRPGPARSS